MQTFRSLRTKKDDEDDDDGDDKDNMNSKENKNIRNVRRRGMIHQKVCKQSYESYKSEGKYMKPHLWIFITLVLVCNCSVVCVVCIFTLIHFYVIPTLFAWFLAHLNLTYFRSISACRDDIYYVVT